MSASARILDDFAEESEFADANEISGRTSARYRADGMPYIEWGGKIWIHRAGAREYLLARIRRRRSNRRSQAGAAPGAV